MPEQVASGQAEVSLGPLVLHAWETVSTERSLQRVLEAIAEVLQPHVHFKAVALVSLSHLGDSLLAAHVAGHRVREGESVHDYLHRPELSKRVEVPPRPLAPYDPSILPRALSG